MTTSRATVLALGLVLLCGCAEENRRLVLGDDVLIEAYSDTGQVEVPVDAPTQTLDRSGWEPTVQTLPVDGVHHQPIYRTVRRTTDNSPRQTGAFPTAVEAATTDEPYSGDQWADAWTVGLRNTLDLLALPVWVFVEPVWADRLSPQVQYARTPVGEPTLPETGLPMGAVRLDPTLRPEGMEPEPGDRPESRAEPSEPAPPTDNPYIRPAPGMGG